MPAPKQYHVAANIPQDFTEEEKQQARDNIGVVDREYFGSDTIGVDSDGVITGKYTGGYGIEIDGNVIKKTHHRLIATNNVQYSYCKVFDFTWQYVYGRGQCVFTASHYGGSYVTFTVSLTRALGADYTVAWPYVVSASDDMLNQSAFIERLEIRSVGNRIVGYLKLRNFAQNQFWLDWEGSSNAGIVSFTPQLTNSPEGTIEWTRTIDKNDVWYSQYDADTIFQKKLTAGRHITIDSDNVISGEGVFVAEYGTTTFYQVQQALAQGDHLVMNLNGGVGECSCACYGGFNSYPDMDEYYFFSLGKGGQSTIYRLDNANQWSTFIPNDADGRVLIAEYNRTTFATIQNAINNGKYVVTKRGTQYYPMIHNFDARVIFNSKANLGWNTEDFCEVDSDSVWTMYTSAAPITTFADHGSTTPSDNWNEVDHTNSFVLAQKGTHGGTMQVGVKLGANGWSGSYKVFTVLYHNSTQTSAPASGTTTFDTVTLTGTEFEEVGLVPQYMLQSGCQWTYIVELSYSNSPGRSIRLTLSGIGSSDITFLGEEIR
jgi:hypothetical protein